MGILKQIYVFLFSVLHGVLVTYAQADFPAQRRAMVETQLKGRDISDRATLEAMSTVPREQFVPQEVRFYSYTDGPLPIGEGQTISQPYIVAYMTQSLRLKPGHRVLEVGTGSGYQAAVLAEIVDSVYTIEIVEKLGIKSRNLLKSLGYDNVRVRIGDGYHGWPEKAPFDAIVVTAAVCRIGCPILVAVWASQTSILPSCDPVIAKRPSSLMATLRTVAECDSG